MTDTSKRLATFRYGQHPLVLYPDRLVDKWRWPWPFKREYPLRGLQADVENVGKGLSLRNQAVLTITGNGAAISRSVKGSQRVQAAISFAAALNAAAAQT